MCATHSFSHFPRFSRSYHRHGAAHLHSAPCVSLQQIPPRRCAFLCSRHWARSYMPSSTTMLVFRMSWSVFSWEGGRIAE